MSAETAPAAPEAAPAKFSRYRSVRRAQTLPPEETQTPQSPPVPAVPPVPPMPLKKEAPISRSMSRYHRRPTVTQPPPPVPANPGFSPSTQAQSPASTPAAAANGTRARSVSSPQHPAPYNTVHPPLPSTSRARPDAATPHAASVASSHTRSQAAREEARQLIEGETERHRRMQEQHKAEKRAKLEAAQAEVERQEKTRKEEEEDAERLRLQREAEEVERQQREQEEKLAEHGRRLQKAQQAAIQRLREEEARKAALEEYTRRNQPVSPPNSPPRHGGGLHLFGRRRKDDAPVAAGRPWEASDSSNRDFSTIKPGGGGAVLGIDAPKSAINAGDRRVWINSHDQRIMLPVTPTTTPLDLIKSAATCLTEPIDVRTAVVLESFGKVGVTRPLRNYEHVRDVMNSWDDDQDNELLITDSATSGIDQQELLASQVPDAKPEGMGCYIHYSSKPGKWSKRYFTLTKEGQLTMAKNDHAKDQENICHLSDFDIYSPTPKKLSKVKPPKKICYAVKSQQKSNIYLDESRFVHFFCINDRSTAIQFYKALQGWRSWYLVNVMGEGQKKSQAPSANPASSTRKVSGNANPTVGSPSHARNASVASHYQLGSFTPLLDLDLFSKEEASKAGILPDTAAAPSSKADLHSMYARKMSMRSKGPPPLSYNPPGLGQENAPPVPKTSNRQNSVTTASGSDSEGATFAPSGLLGRQYTQRQRALQEKDQQPSGPFTEGPSLLSSHTWNLQSSGNEGGLARKASVQSKHGRSSSDIQRSMSTRTRQRPLIDLTPQYREPPQHARKGRGFIPEGHAGPLIENATSIEEAIKVPPSTDWRARPTTARPTHGTYGTGGYERTRSLKGHGDGLAAYTVNNHACVPDDDSRAFTGGLLAKAGFSQGSVPVGHGVMDGSKARGPMLDIREPPKFASGSLLASVERQHGGGGPVIDRSARRQSVDLS